MKKLFAILFAALSTLFFTLSYGQVAINNTAANPDSSAVLDLNTGNTGVNKGFLAPQVALVNVASPSPVSGPATGLIVYSTTAPSGGSGIGYYYWSGTQWNYFYNSGTPFKDTIVTTISSQWTSTANYSAVTITDPQITAAIVSSGTVRVDWSTTATWWDGMPWVSEPAKNAMTYQYSAGVISMYFGNTGGASPNTFFGVTDVYFKIVCIP